MPRVLFWNVQRKQLDSLVMSLVAKHSLDVVVQVERPPRSGLSAALSPGGWQRVGRSERFTVFAKQSIRFTREPNPDPTDRVEFWHVEPAGKMTGCSRWFTAPIGGTRPTTRGGSSSVGYGRRFGCWKPSSARGA